MPEEKEVQKGTPSTVELGPNDSAAVFRGSKIEFIVSDSKEEEAVMGQTGMSIIAAVLTDPELNSIIMNKMVMDIKNCKVADLMQEEEEVAQDG